MNHRSSISNTRRDASVTMTRRSVFKVLAGAAVAVAATGGVTALANHTSQSYTVTANANVRSGPSTGYAILGVARPGDTLTLRGQLQNGYAAIVFKGQNGWVLAALVVEVGATGSDPMISGSARTTANVNLRSGPSTGHKVLRVVPGGAKIGTSTTVRDGFRYVSYDGQAGWMADAYIGAGNPNDQGGNYKTTTANLNLRAEPSTSARILTVIPAGRQVQVLHTQAGQYVNVNYDGQQGWVAAAYLT